MGVVLSEKAFERHRNDGSNGARRSSSLSDTDREEGNNTGYFPTEIVDYTKERDA